MHPLNHKFFGANGMKTKFYNGSSVVAGYVTKQVGPGKFTMTDGTNHATVALAPTTAIATALGSNPTYGTIPVYGAASSATGSTFTVSYGVLSAAVAVQSGSNYFNVSDSLALPSGAGALTVATLSGTNIATVTVGTAGSYTSLFANPVTATRAAGTGSTITGHYGVYAATIVGGAGGSAAGYTATNVLTLSSSGGATITVDTVDGGGGILTYHISAVGTVTSLLSNPVAVTGGTGTGATFNLTYKLVSLTATTAGSGYNIGDTVHFAGMTATTTPVATVLTINGSHQPTGFTISNAGANITVAASSITTNVTTATFTLTYSVVSISATAAGSGYAVNDELFFEGIVTTTLPQAHISSVNGSNQPTGVTVDTAGTGITVAATSVVTAGAVEYASHIYASKLVTTAGNSYEWALGTSVNGSAVILTYNDDEPSF